MIETPNKFALIIENMVKEKKISYIDAILEYCKDNEIDPANTRSMINKTLKENALDALADDESNKAKSIIRLMQYDSNQEVAMKARLIIQTKTLESE